MGFDFTFALNEKFIVFILALVLFAFWQIMKLSKPNIFASADLKQQEKSAQLITMVNLVVAIAAAFILTGFKIVTNFWDGLGNVLIIFGSGSIFDILKAYKIVK